MMCKAIRIPEAGRYSATSPLFGTSTTIKGIFCFHRIAIIFACSCGFTFFAHAEKAWIRPISGLWRVGTNWSGGTPPDITSFIQITNDSTKVVTIDAATPASNLTVQRLSISAPNAATNTLLVADLGAGNPLTLQDTLTILAGGALRVTNSAVIVDIVLNHVNVDGDIEFDSGSITIGGQTVETRVGRAAVGTLEIESGKMDVGILEVGDLTGAQGTVTITGGTLNVSSLLGIGNSTMATGVVSVAGGQIVVAGNSTNVTRIGDSGFGQMVVSNASVSLQEVNVGRHDGAVGTLVIQTNALISCTGDLSIGRYSGATGQLLITGGNLIATNSTIWVGREGVGQMNVSGGQVRALRLLVGLNATNSTTSTMSLAGGEITVSSNLVVGSSSVSTSQVFIAGANLSVTNISKSGDLIVSSGTLTLNGGIVTVDNLIVTNSSGQFVFGGGTLNTAGTVISRGLPFVVGDGTNQSTLHLLGGSHSFANGLIISSNASLTGCGTIIGSIVNHGTIATNCSGATIPPTITNVAAGRDTFSFSFQSQNNVAYTIEYKNTLNDPSWVTLTVVTGAGSLMPVTDPLTNLASRFYRIRIQ